jgi:hypothetical protein
MEEWITLTPCGCRVKRTPGAHRHECFGPCFSIEICAWHRAMSREVPRREKAAQPITAGGGNGKELR